jgi:hypothetical protein
VDSPVKNLNVIMLRQTLITCLLVCTAASAQAEDVVALPGPGTQAERFEQLLDLRSNVSLVRHPQLALELADAVSDPDFLMAAMMMSANPEVWLKAIERAGAAGVPKNLAQVASPDMLADWFFSSIDPQFQQAILSRMLDPKKPQRWMQAMTDPRYYMPALAMMNPATPMQWMKVTADGRMIQPMQVWFDPKTYLNWMRLPMPVASGVKKNGDKAPPPASYMWKPPQRY